ncbi:MAG: hypothetical protein PWP12_794 [Bacillota bacterium]|nr:hypothetical protein [Bacillota bacterium]MDK2882916.1 hypothetical protein [Bacillota bacterium]MDK2960610.1 hypothetical protein [Bacillota bacterium]
MAPADLGRRDVLIAGEKIAAIGPELEVPKSWACQEVRLEGYFLVPGFIDGHVHLIGGGGEGGYATRTPEVNLSAVTRAGVTTVIGCLGTDGTTRHMASLLAKARGLECEGISAYIYTGAYEVPTRTLTGSVRTDLIIIDKVIGTGEIAISDHRSAQPLRAEIQKLAAEARVGGMLSGKAGVMNLHVGDGKSGLKMLFEIVEESEIPITQFIPTHVNRNPWLLQHACEWGKRGGYVDVTSGVSPASGAAHSIKPSQAVRQLLAEGVELSRITMSSDGNGSMPCFDEKGNIIGLMVATQDSLLTELRDLVRVEGLPLAEVVQVITSNVAKALKLWPRKGSIQVGSDADFAVLTPDITLYQVWARGRLMVDEGKPVVWGTFEKQLN